MVIAP